MTSFISDRPSQDAINVLRLLKSHHNVLLAGPPATGKSRLLAEVRYWFVKASGLLAGDADTGFSPTGAIAFPTVTDTEQFSDWLPGEERVNRKVLTTTFHQGTKYRDFVGGMVPNVTEEGRSFVVTHGTLIQASDFVKLQEGASLVEIDEINRGPAVAVFGDTITAIESDKRLLPNGDLGEMTTTFRLQLQNGTLCDYALPYHLYMLAAMNEADTSVEPLDVAFLRRFVKYRLETSEITLRNYFGLPEHEANISEVPNSAQDVFEAATQVWVRINERIELARGGAMKIGHGIFMELPPEDLPDNTQEALKYILSVWPRLLTHVQEVFFGDTRGQAAALRATLDRNPYILEERFFADTPVLQLKGPSIMTIDLIYETMRAIAGGE